MCKLHFGSSQIKLSFYARKGIKEPVPRTLLFLECEAVRDFTGCSNSGAGDSIVESKYPDPATLEDMMNRRCVDWIGRFSLMKSL